MATVPGPPVTLAQIRAVYGAPAGTPLHQFYRGGPYVPNIPQNAGVPTAPPIVAHQLCGSTNYVPMSSNFTGGSNPSCTYHSPATTCTASVSPTCNVSNGIPPYSYSWSIVGGSSATIANATSATCTVSRTANQTQDGTTSQLQCVVTDSTSAQITPQLGLNWGFESTG